MTGIISLSHARVDLNKEYEKKNRVLFLDRDSLVLKSGILIMTQPSYIYRVHFSGMHSSTPLGTHNFSQYTSVGITESKP